MIFLKTVVGAKSQTHTTNFYRSGFCSLNLPFNVVLVLCLTIKKRPDRKVAYILLEKWKHPGKSSLSPFLLSHRHVKVTNMTSLH